MRLVYLVGCGLRVMGFRGGGCVLGRVGRGRGVMMGGCWMRDGDEWRFSRVRGCKLLG